MIPAILPNCHNRSIEGIIGTLGRRGIPLVVHSPKADCPAFHSRYVVEHAHAPDPADESDYIAFLLNETRPGVLYPADDITALLFARHSDTIRAHGFLLNVPTYRDLMHGFDKWLCHCHASALGIPCAATALIEDATALATLHSRSPLPLILKATTLAGGVYTRVDRKGDLCSAYETMRDTTQSSAARPLAPRLIAQEWMDYPMHDIWCVEAFYDRHGQARGVWPVRKLRTVILPGGTFGSRLYAGRSTPQPRLEALTRTLLDSLSWRGFAHLDWVYSRPRDDFVLTEINPRLPGFSAFPSKAGFDFAYYYYADLTGREYDYCPSRPAMYFELFRYPGDLTESLNAIRAGRCTLWSIVRSYLAALADPRRVVVDFCELGDLPMMGAHLKALARSLCRRLLQDTL